MLCEIQMDFRKSFKTYYYMFNFFKKNPAAQLEKKYEKLLEEAMQLQRKGDIKGYAVKSAEAEEVLKEIEKINQVKD
jgi:hypothetical protein